MLIDSIRALSIAARMKIKAQPVFLFALLLAAALSVANAYAQSDGTTKLPAANQSGQNDAHWSIVKGRALYEDTGQPAPRERVQLVASEFLAKHRDRYRIPTAITDANGVFIFHRVGAGEYYVVVRPADEHVPSAEAAPVPLQTGDAAADAARLKQYKKEFIKITVSGETPVEIDLRVRNPHFGVISGRIVNANGEPAVGANVSVMRTSERVFGTAMHTGEDGAYRIIGLPAGEYIVSASPPPKMINGGDRPKVMEGLLGATYFPSTIDSDSSPPVVVYPDHETGDINITLAARSLHSVAGTVRKDSDGHPVAGATVRLTRKDGGDQASGTGNAAGFEAAMSNYFSATDTQGRWSVSNLPDGTYTIFVRPSPVVSADTETHRFVEKRQDLTVAGADVEDLAIVVSPAAILSGRVLSAPGGTPLSRIGVMLIPTDQSKGEAYNSMPFGVTNEQGSFVVSGAPGEYFVVVWRLGEKAPTGDRDSIKKFSANALRVTLGPGERKSMDLVK